MTGTALSAKKTFSAQMSEEERAKLFDDDAPLPPDLPRLWYSCASDFCAEDQSFRDEDLFLSDKDGRFW